MKYNEQSAYTKEFLRLNASGKSNYIPPIVESSGYVFITRPMLNLSYNNIKMHRQLMAMETGNVHNNIPTYIRLLLDPLLGLEDQYSDMQLLDRFSPWNTLLSNSVKELTGWPDQMMDVTTSDPGKFRETVSIADGTAIQAGSETLNATFQNGPGNPLGFMFRMWMWYMSLEHEGTVIPHEFNLLPNRKDYDVGIWRLVMDQNNRYVISIGFTTGFPTVNPSGALLNYSDEKLLSDENLTYSVTFHCDGFMVDDPILPSAFNSRLNFMNSSITDYESLKRSFTKVTAAQATVFDEQVYPWINEATNELEWWVDTIVYKNTVGE